MHTHRDDLQYGMKLNALMWPAESTASQRNSFLCVVFHINNPPSILFFPLYLFFLSSLRVGDQEAH